jgi:pimeloyl-ACP methyl ester carboxylesterase
MSTLAYSRSGAGPPLVLLHPLGSSRQVWDPVVPALAAHHDVVAVDLPGFGDSPPLPPDVEPSPAVLAAAVAGLLDDLGMTTPHLAGNSLGGWVALELADLRPTASLTLLAPAGLWRHGTPRYDRVSLGTSHWLSVHAGRLLARLVGHGAGRVLVLGQTHGHPVRTSPARARLAVATLGSCPGFDATFRATLDRRYLSPPVSRTPAGAPVTVAFGTRDLVLLAHQSRHLDQLPAGTVVRSLPGCGHLPVGDDPGAVAALVLDCTRRATTSSPPVA